MSNADAALVAEKEAEAAVAEFLEMRAAILGRLSPEALRCVAAIFERRMEEKKEKKTLRGKRLELSDARSLVVTRGLLLKPASSAAFVVDSVYFGC